MTEGGSLDLSGDEARLLAHILDEAIIMMRDLIRDTTQDKEQRDAQITYRNDIRKLRIRLTKKFGGIANSVSENDETDEADEGDSSFENTTTGRDKA